MMATLWPEAWCESASAAVEAMQRLYDCRASDKTVLQAARAALAKGGFRSPDTSTVMALSAEIVKALPGVLRALGTPSTPPDDLDPSTPEGAVSWVHELDERAAEYLAALGEAGVKAGEAIRENSEKRREAFLAHPDPDTVSRMWCLWYNPDGDHAGTVGRFLLLLARVLWKDIVGPRLQREREARHPALAAVVVDRAMDTLWSPGRSIEPRGDTWVVRRGDGLVVATYEPSPTCPSVPTILTDELRVTRSLAAHRILRLLVGQGYRQKYIEKVADPRVVDILGGFRGLAQTLGVPSRSAARDLEAALTTMQRVHLELGSIAVGGLLTWTELRAAPGRPARLRIVLGDPLLPGFVSDLPKGTKSAREQRRLVPFPEALPPLVGRPNEHAAQAALQVAVLREMRVQAGRLATEGAVEILLDRWHDLARECSLPALLVPRVIDRWTQDGDDAPAFLAPRGTDRFDLAPAYEGARQLLVDAGTRELRNSKRGKTSARNRATGKRRQSNGVRSKGVR
ncbi:MAG: hypothetical protein JRI25_12200 [Deltaproteobacteria bacterium]|nr:hypothetical protein [Deltaproteobacteria bacterium]